MAKNNWYPATIAALILGCGGATDDSNATSTGGSSSIDTGAPTNTGGHPVYFYGVRIFTGGTAAQDNATGGATTFDMADGGKSAVGTGGAPMIAFGGAVALYGPRFDRPKHSLISSGGSNSSIPSDAEGGALQDFANGRALE
jgi:hypothetical protein